MNTHKWIDRFCESRRRHLIVAAVTSVVAVATVLPQVGQYLGRRAEENEKTCELEQASRTAGLLAPLRERAADTAGELERLQRRALPAAAVPRFRNRLVDMVRESGCRVRRISLGAVATRHWREDDLALLGPQADAGADTPFVLETRPVNVSVTGGLEEARRLLKKIESSGLLLHSRAIDMRPTGRAGAVQMELQLWCFALTRPRENA